MSYINFKSFMWVILLIFRFMRHQPHQYSAVKTYLNARKPMGRIICPLNFLLAYAEE